MKSLRLSKYTDFKTKINELVESETSVGKIDPKDPRIDIVDNFVQCIGYPNQGTHAASDWASRNAWDLAAPAGSNVYALFDGKLERIRKSAPGITKVGVKRLFGDQVSVETTDPNLPDVFYTHIDSVFTTADIGKEIKKGDLIGTLSDMVPSHLHIGLEYGKLLDYVGSIDKTTASNLIPPSSSVPSSSKITPQPDSLPATLKVAKVYNIPNDKYKYCVNGGVWYAKEGIKDPKNNWMFFNQWISLEMNMKKVEELDLKFPGARTSEMVELNRQKFGSNDDQVRESLKQWYEKVGAGQDFKNLTENSTSNNNPGAIRFHEETKDLLGCVGDQGGYCKFATEGHGYKAIETILKKYYNEEGLNTIAEIIPRYAPPIVNNMEKYIQTVTSKSGISATTALGEDDLVKLIPGIVEMETATGADESKVRNSIADAESSDPEAANSITFEGEFCKIYTPRDYEGTINMLVFLPMMDNTSAIKDFVVRNYSDWSTKTSFIFPTNFDMKWNDLLEDIDECFDDNDLSMGYLSVFMYGESANRSLIDTYNVDELRNLVLVNPKLDSSLAEVVNDLPADTNIITTYDPNESVSQQQETNSIIEFKRALRERDKDPNKFFRLIDKEGIELFSETLSIFKEDIEQNFEI
jgi:hypothetical protein